MRAFADHRIARAVRRRTKPTISRLLSADFRSSEGAYSSCAACSASTKLDENRVKYFLRPRFRCPVSGYAFGAARQSFEFGDAAHGLPAGCHSPGVGRTLAVTVSAHAYELARSRPGRAATLTFMNRWLKYIAPAAILASAIAVIAWTTTLTHPSGAPLGHGKVR